MPQLILRSAIVYLGAAVLVSGCANTIYRSEIASETRKVYLLDLGRHTRLAFGMPGQFVEYGYGEWKWYAEMEDQWWRVPATLLWPTRGTLGRREWSGARAEDRLLQEYAGLNVLRLSAEKTKVDALVAELNREFNRRSDRMIHNRTYDLYFVPWDRPYWLCNNSNHAVKEWLEALGYEVTGSGIFARWRSRFSAR